MANRIPIVMVNGQFQQLQSGDTLNSASSTYSSESLQNADSVMLVAGTAVYVSASGAVKRTNASALATSAGVVGLVLDPTIAAGSNGNVILDGSLTLTVAQWDAVITGDSTGLSFGATYFLDPSTPGNITTTAPTTAGQVVVPIGKATSATTLDLNVGTSVLL